jgi:hypothetical protein
MYYIEENNNIVLFNESRNILENTINLSTRYQGLPIQETTEGYTIVDYQLMSIEEADNVEANNRQELFLKDFFKVNGYGYYRRVPKGYQSAVESMNVLFNIANLTKGLQAGLIIFYEEPDFTDAEQCTEEWLIEHQIIMPAMTLEEFMQLYVAFMTAWNTTEH